MRNKMLRVFVLAISFIVLISLIGGLGSNPAYANEKVYKWRMPIFCPAAGPFYKMMKRFCDDVKTASNGRLEITPYGAGEIIPVLQTWEACSKGIIDINWSFGAYWTGKTKMAAISVGLPFTATSLQDAQAILYEAGVEDLIRKEYAKHNIHLLKTFPVHQTVLCTKFPFKSPEDLKGKKIRAGGVQAEVANELGLSTAFFPVPEVYGALDTGVVDGVIMGGIVVARNFSFYEVTKYVMQPQFDVACEEIQINKNSWEKLPEDLKMILKTCVAKAAFDRASWIKYQDTKDLNYMQKEWGINIATMPPGDVEKMKESAMRIYDKWAKESPAFAEALEIIKGYMEKKEKMG